MTRHKDFKIAENAAIDAQTQFELPYKNMTASVDFEHDKHNQWGIVVETNLKAFKNPNSTDVEYVGDRLMITSESWLPFLAMTGMIEQAIKNFIDEHRPPITDTSEYAKSYPTFEEMKYDAQKSITESAD